MLLLDASVILAAFDSDDDLHEPAKAILADPEVTLGTLDLARYEVVNVALGAWRAPDEVAPLLQAVDQISTDGVVVVSSTTLLLRAAQIGERHTISIYDATYVAAARQTGSTLVSCDSRDLVGNGLASSPIEVIARTGTPTRDDTEAEQR